MSKQHFFWQTSQLQSEGTEQCCTILLLKKTLRIFILGGSFEKLWCIVIVRLGYFFNIYLFVSLGSLLKELTVFCTNINVVVITAVVLSYWQHGKSRIYNLLIYTHICLLYNWPTGSISTRENMEHFAWDPSTGQKYYYW